MSAAEHADPTGTDISRHPLADARHGRGWSQEALALLLRNRGLGTTRKSVRRWERGTVPDATAQHALGDLFGVSPAARARAAWPDWLPSGHVSGAKQAWDSAGAIEALTEVSERAIVDRREFLALVGPELLLPIYMWRLNPGPWLAYQAHGQAVSASLVTEIQRLAAIRRHMDDEHGGAALLDMLHSDLRFVTGMLKHGSYSDSVGRDLYATAAELSRLAGWAAFDSGRHAAAQQYYLAGLRAASAAGDSATSVNIVGFLGIQAYSTGRLSDAVQLMDAATEESRSVPAVVQAIAWARSGRAYAKLGDRATARKALNKAAALQGRAVVGDTPPWAYWFDQTRLAAQLGRALFDLGDYQNAERELSAAVTECADRYPRDRATWQGRIAIAQLRAGKLDSACASGQKTVDLLASQVESERALGFLRTFKDEISPFQHSPAARDFTEYARTRLGSSCGS